MRADVGGDVVEALGAWVFRAGLSEELALAGQKVVAWQRPGRTWISLMAGSSLATLRETMTRLAPFAASILAALKPIPSDAPVIRMVCDMSAVRLKPVLFTHLAVHRHLVPAEETHCGS